MIGIPVTSNCNDPNISDRFGRSDYFAIIDEGRIIKCLENKCKHTPSSAGIVALKLLLDNGVSTIIAYYIGSTTKSHIQKHNLKVFESESSIKVSEALKLLKLGKLNNMM